MLAYFFKIASGTFTGLDTEAVGNVFNTMLSNPGEMTFWMVIVTAFGFGTCCMGLQKGVERITKVMMVCLLTIMVVLCVKSCTLPGAIEGIKFYLLPDFGRLKENGLLSGIYAAMGQAFFTLSLGIGAMAIFGSYIDKDRSLMGESIQIGILDTFVALMAGLIIFPACFAYNVSPTQGVGLVFVTLPNMFNQMMGGRFWGALFFIFMTFAALSTIIAVFENILSFAMDLWGWSRKKAVLVNGIAILFIHAMHTWFQRMERISATGRRKHHPGSGGLHHLQYLLPLGSLVYLLFCVTRYGWGWDNFIKEADTGNGIKFPKWARPYLTYVLPLIVLLIFVMGYYDKFFR